MAKKALVSTIEPRGRDNLGYRVVEVVDPDNTFDTHPNLQWYDCDDTVEVDKYWFDPSNSTFKKVPDYIDPVEAVGELAVDAEGNTTEYHSWDWDNSVWTKVPK